MKKLLTLATLPVIFLIVVLAAHFFADGQYLAAYALIASWLFAFTFWIHRVGLLFEKQPAAKEEPRIPRAYITNRMRA
jgi:Na+/H+ antiporter NhaC